MGAERANRALIETGTLTGTSGNAYLNNLLRNLPDRGPPVDITDNYESKLSMWNHLKKPGTYLTVGQGGVYSAISGKVKRVGDQIGLDGWVTHRFDNRTTEDNQKGRFSDTYNFNPGQPGHGEARILEPRGRARPFDIDYTRKQSLTGIIRLGRDGGLTLERAIWGEPQ